MSKHQFYLADDDSLIIIPCKLDENEHDLSLAFDTAASHTVIDLNALLIAGYIVKDAVRSAHLETAKGTVEALVFQIDNLTALGLPRFNMEVCSYDFLANNILTDIDGVLGLDFFKGTYLGIDFKRFEITVTL